MSVVGKIRESLKLSLGYFDPKELEILLLTSLKTTMQGAWKMIKYFSWWLFIFGAYIELVVDGPAIFGRLWEYITPLVMTPDIKSKVFGVTMLLLIFFVMLSVRASLQIKKTSYYLSYLLRLPLFIALFLILPQLFLFPVFWFATFFFLDAQHSLGAWLRSLYNGVMLSVGYAPFVIFIGAFHGVLYHLHNFAWSLIYIEDCYGTAYSIKFTTSALLYLFFAAMLGNFYLRVKHSNGKLFLKGKKAAAKTKSAKEKAA